MEHALTPFTPWSALAGGLLFGAGWGVAGFCPGPAIVAASQGLPQAWLFMGALLAGMTVHDKLAAR